uniref:glycosyltransferase family 25 protein n=1 Tax=uncultured Sphingomonas sp. TaxID=158754 RepID=UPI0035C992AA
MIPSYLINLDRSADRLAFVTKRLQALGISYSRIVAVDGGKLSPAEQAAFIALRPRDGRSWGAGQIGCFMSHGDAWQNIADGAAPFGLVIEDDIHLSDAAPALLADATWIPADADIVRLESTGQWLSLGQVAATIDGRTVRRVRSAAWGAGAYILTKAAAAKLLAAAPVLHTPVDDFLFNVASSAVAQSLTTYQVTPALAEQDKFKADQSTSKGFGSGIETGKINQRLHGLGALRRAITSTLRGKSRVEFR